MSRIVVTICIVTGRALVVTIYENGKTSSEFKEDYDRRLKKSNKIIQSISTTQKPQ
jgi:hypothetical protein